MVMDGGLELGQGLLMGLMLVYIRVAGVRRDWGLGHGFRGRHLEGIGEGYGTG